MINRYMDEGYLQFDKSKIGDLSNVDTKDVIILISDDKERPFANTFKIVRGYDKYIKIKETDTIFITEPSYAGVEKRSAMLLDEIAQTGANGIMLSKKDCLLHHASSEDLMLMINLMNPKYYFPVRGEYRDLYANAEVAEACGMNKDNIILKLNGEVAEFVDGELTENRETIPVEQTLISGNQGEDVVVCVVGRNILSGPERLKIFRIGFIEGVGLFQLRSLVIEQAQFVVKAQNLLLGLWGKGVKGVCVAHKHVFRAVAVHPQQFRPVIQPVTVPRPVIPQIGGDTVGEGIGVSDTQIGGIHDPIGDVGGNLSSVRFGEGGFFTGMLCADQHRVGELFPDLGDGVRAQPGEDAVSLILGGNKGQGLALVRPDGQSGEVVLGVGMILDDFSADTLGRIAAGQQNKGQEQKKNF